MTFDYDNEDGTVDLDTVLSVVAQITDAGKLPPITEEQRLQHEAWLFESRQRDRQMRLEHERRQAEANAAAEREARQQEAIARSERTRRMQEEQRQQADRQMRDAQIASLHRASLEQQQYRNATLRSARFAAQRQILDSALTHLSPPPPPPEPTVVVVSEDDGSADFGSRNFDVAKWSKKPRSWF